MKTDDLLRKIADMQVTVGYGEDSFTMSRGSFRYKTKETGAKTLTKKEDGTESPFLTYRNGDSMIVFRVEETDTGIRLVLDTCTEPWDRYRLTFPMEADEHVYGCGETHAKFDLAGEKVRIWVAEHQNARRIGGKVIRERFFGPKPEKVSKFGTYESYYAQPTFTSSEKYFVHANTDLYAEFDFSKKGCFTLMLEEAPDVVFGCAEDFPALSEKLTELLGRPRKLPDWLNDGAIVAVQEGNEKVTERIARAREAGAAINGVWSQDWCGCRRTGFGYQVMWNWKADDVQYPDLEDHIKAWHEDGIRFLGYINPFLAIEKDLYEEAAAKGYTVKDKEGKDYLVTITTFPAAMIDLTNPDAYRWMKDIIKNNMIAIGMDGWMADFGEYLPVDCVLFDGSDPKKLHNTWPAIWAGLNREAIMESGKEDSVFFFTRAGHTGTIAASDMMWTGDQHVDWSVDDGMPSVIPATLSLAMSGFAIIHSDVGGYTTIMQMVRGKELLMRWEEMNAFSPLYRFHEGNQPSRNVQFDTDEVLLRQLSEFSRIHAGLKEYLAEAMEEACGKGTPVMRPVFYHYDEKWAYAEKAEYLLGRDILVCPVLKESTAEWDARLPEDEWIHLFTGEEYKGGVYKVEAPIGEPPVFIRKASPWAEKIQAMIKEAKIASEDIPDVEAAAEAAVAAEE